jgi:hypothetical protein
MHSLVSTNRSLTFIGLSVILIGIICGYALIKTRRTAPINIHEICPLKKPNSDRRFWISDRRLVTINNRQIQKDLGPLQKLNFTRTVWDKVFEEIKPGNHPFFWWPDEMSKINYHFIIKNSKIYYREQGPHSVYGDKFLKMILAMSNLVDLPDSEFLVHDKLHGIQCHANPYPVFSMVKSHDNFDILLPSPSSSVWEGKMRTCPSTPLSTRIPKLFWRGSCVDPLYDRIYFGARLNKLIGSYRRVRLAIKSKYYSELMDVKLTENCKQVGDKVFNEPEMYDVVGTDSYSFADYCKHRYVLLFGDPTVDPLSHELLRSGSVIFIVDTPFYEHYNVHLQPWVHYIPVDRYLLDLEKKIAWANANPDKVAQLVKNLNEFVDMHLTREAMSCYMYNLLTSLRRQMTHRAGDGLDLSQFTELKVT